MTDKKTIKQALQLCVHSLNEKECSEQNAKQVTQVIQQLYKASYQGRGLGIGDFGRGNYRAQWEDYRARWQDREKIQHILDWKDAFILLADALNITENELFELAQQITNADIMFNHILKHIITNCVVQDDIKQALSYIPHFKETHIFKYSDNQDEGYLILLQYFARKGDDKNFFKYFKQAKPAINRYEVGICKNWLVQRFCANNTLDEALKLCKHRNLGKKFYYDALCPFATKGMYQELKEIFANQPELKQPEIYTEIKILIAAYANAVANKQKIDDDFEYLFEQCVSIDRKVRWGDVKLQDAMLLDLGIASQKLGSNESALKCRKAIKDNRMKKELVIKK